MPLGLFKEVAVNNMLFENETIRAAYRKHDIYPNQIFQIEFSQSCHKVEQVKEDLWLLPALRIEVDGIERIIIGKLPLLAPNGMLTATKSSIDEMWKIWPQFLLYRLAMKSLPIHLEPQVIALYAAKPKKAFFDDPLPYIKSFVKYYDQSHKQISPLMPEWVSYIAKQNAEGLRKKMDESFEKGTIDSVNWVLNKNNLPCPETVIQLWKAPLDAMADDLFKAWGSTKAKEGEEE